jgi:nucleoside-diphosphate-sugar epimerase
MEKVLVTGGAGYVGSVLVPKLLRRGYDVTVFDNLTFGGEGLIMNFNDPNFNFIRGDIRDEDKLKSVIQKHDAVVHLAAIVGYPACKKDPELAFRINEGGTRFVTDTISLGQKLVFASTGSNYGAVIDNICTEDTPLNPLTVYGKSKTNAEKHIMEKSDSINAVVLRFATAFGISPRMRLDLLINDFTYKVIKENYLLIYEKDHKRTFIEVGDMADSFIFALEHMDSMKGQAYNVGSNNMNFSKADIASMLKKYKDYFLHFADAGKDEDQRNYEVSYDKINMLGFSTKMTIDEGIDKLVKSMSVIEVPKKYTNA